LSFVGHNRQKRVNVDDCDAQVLLNTVIHNIISFKIITQTNDIIQRLNTKAKSVQT